MIENEENRIEVSGQEPAGPEAENGEREQALRRSYRSGMVFGIVATLLMMAAALLGYRLARARSDVSVISDPKVQEKLAYLEQMIDSYYLEEKDPEALAEGLYTGMIYGLGDPYSRYYTAQEYEQERESNDGSYVGIGILMGKDAGEYAQVHGVYEGSPSELAGMQAGDEIRAVDGEDVRPMTSTELVSAIRGAQDQVQVTVYREETEETLDLDIQVRNVEIPSVSSQMLEEKIGKIRITEFTGVTSEQFRAALEELRQQGAEKLVVDLRDNPGGLVTAVCDVLRQILPEGLIVYTEDRFGKREEETCDGTHELELPLAVLVNGDSASASEIFAGAVQDYGLGPIVGETTYGKGIVQALRGLTDGSAVQLTIANYYTPKGKNIHGAGIEPDIPVEDIRDDEWDPVLEAALEVLKQG